MENERAQDRWWHFLVPGEPCNICQARCQGGLCRECRAELPRNLPACPICALPLTMTTPCPDCLQKPPPYACTLAPLRYEFPVDVLIQGLKFHGRLHLARLFGLLLAGAAEGLKRKLPEVLIPMPLHRSRLRTRGFNQSLELARTLGKVLRIPVDPHCCLRRRATPPQIGLSARQRRKNLRGAFESSGAFPYRHVAIIDDVITTGASMTALARCLRQAGATRVEAWALARAPVQLIGAPRPTKLPQVRA